MDAFAPRPRKPFLALAGCAIGGILLAEVVAIPLGALILVAVALAGVALWFPRPAAGWAVTVASFAALHSFYHVENPARRYGASLAEPHPARASGVVWSEPNVFDAPGKAGASFWLKLEHLEPSAPVFGQLCLVRWAGPAPSYGDRVQLAGSAHAIAGPRNPGEFDKRAWLARQGVHFEIDATSPRDCVIVEHRRGDGLRHFAIDARGWIKSRLDAGLPPDPETSTLINSMVLGLRGDSPPELKELFQKTGTLHLFAVSGLNVAMLALIAWLVLKALGVSKRKAALVIIPFLAAYAVVVGMSASCVRATVVASFVLLAALWEREPIPLNSLAAAAVCILAWETNELFNPGFQLSFILVLAIVGLSRRFQRPIERAAEPDDFIPQRLWSVAQRARVACARIVAETVGVGLAAWVGSALFMWGYFHIVSPVAIFANLLAVPLAFCVLALGLFSLITSLPFLGFLTVTVNHANWACAQTLIGVVEKFSNIPRGHAYLEWPRLGARPACELVALDVGEGAAIHVRAGDSDWLIDAGRARDYRHGLLPYLRSRGVDQLDGLILTHGDAAHLGGAALLLEDFRPGWVADCAALDRSPSRRAVHAELAARQVGRRFFWRGDEFPLAGGARVRVLYPPPGSPQRAADDKALVLRVEVAQRRILLTSDAGFAVEAWLLKHEPDLRADVLVKGWSDRDFSGTPDFISAVQPRAIVCAARGFGSTDDSFYAWAAPLRARGIAVLSQPECGAVRVEIGRDAELRVTPWR